MRAPSSGGPRSRAGHEIRHRRAHLPPPCVPLLQFRAALLQRLERFVQLLLDLIDLLDVCGICRSLTAFSWASILCERRTQLVLERREVLDLQAARKASASNVGVHTNVRPHSE